MREHHAPLGMSAGELKQRTERGARISARLLEAERNVVADVRERERRELPRNGLIKQRPFGIGEKLLHDARSRAGEAIGRSFRLMLDHAPDLPVSTWNGKNILDLVEHYEAGGAFAIEEGPWQFQQTEQYRLRVDVRIALQCRGEAPARLSRSSWKFGDGGPGVIVTQ
jgi:hypothetical protein